MSLKKQIALIVSLITLKVFSFGQSPDLGIVCAEDTAIYGVTGFSDSEFIWSVEGGVIVGGDGEDTIQIQWGYNTGEYRLEVVEITSGNCTGVPSVGRVKVQAPQVNLGFDFYEICQGDSVKFDASGKYDGKPNYLWFDNSTKSEYTARNTGLIWVKVTDGLGCTRFDSIDFVAHQNPTIHLGHDTILCDKQIPLEVDAGDYASYQWITSGGESYSNNPVYIYPVQIPIDSLKVIVTDNHNCTATDTMLIFACNIRELFKNMPNTITPNGDGTNDVWHIPYMDQFPKAVLEIFDRWGRLVYHTNNVLGEPWDGTSNGREMPMDSYFYVLDLKFLNFEPLSGSVNLIR